MADSAPNGTPAADVDVEMKEEAVLEAPLGEIQLVPDLTDPQPPPQAQSAAAPSLEHLSTIQPPVAASTPPIHSTPTTRPGSMPPQPPAKPEKPVAHGGPTRQYLNQMVTPHLLEGMKYLAVYEPEKPLSWLSDFLKERSKEVEG